MDNFSRQETGLELQEQLARLKRGGLRRELEEQSRVTASGSVTAAWLIEVVSCEQYNVYNVRQVSIVGPGLEPVTLGGSNGLAYNLAELFTEAGTLSAGTLAVMWRVGDENVFYVQP
ncbi:MAG: hypothetical protein JXD22_13240 [Sedimentisphaerales bacterium]|nr:hypothetical protein [Sedimentisphaerales bacterium]